MSEVVKPAFELKKVGKTLRAEPFGGHPTQSTTCFAVNNDGTILALGASKLTTVNILYVSRKLPTEDYDRFSFTDTEDYVKFSFTKTEHLVDSKRPDTRTYISDEYVRSIAFHPLFPVLATGGGPEERGGTVTLWHMSPDGHPYTSRTINVDSRINSVAFHPTEKLLATGSSDKTTRVWSFTDDYKELICEATLTHGGHTINDVVNVVAFHPDKKQIFLASGCNGPNTSRLWKLNPENLMDEPEYKILDNEDAIRTLAFHPSGKLLATGDAGHNLKLWDFNNYDSISCVNTLSQEEQGHTSSVVSVAFHPTGDFLATGSWDRSAKVWSYSSEGREVRLVATHAYNPPSNSVNSVAFYPVQKGRVPILAIGRTGGLFETYELTRPSSGVSDGGTRRRTPRRHRRRTQTRTRRRSRKQQQRSRRRHRR
jgi:WD40 repeat protein